MLIFEDIDTLKQHLKDNNSGQTIGFVPTMGALHQGHLSLINSSKKENDITVCSIFVNPTQFDNNEDLKKYPRNLQKDKEMLEANGCDILFVPSEREMYHKTSGIVKISFGYLETVMEGQYRPGHFNGVGIVVMKLFNIVAPDRAYFGQKDLQQFVVISNLVRELNINVTLRCMPILRENDGLAMSSRNVRLNEQERQNALIFYKSLKRAENLLAEGKPVRVVKQEMKEFFQAQPQANLEYFEIVNAQDLLPIEDDATHQKDIALCVAGYIGEVRLIDNMIL